MMPNMEIWKSPIHFALKIVSLYSPWNSDENSCIICHIRPIPKNDVICQKVEKNLTNTPDRVIYPLGFQISFFHWDIIHTCLSNILLSLRYMTRSGVLVRFFSIFVKKILSFVIWHFKLKCSLKLTYIRSSFIKCMVWHGYFRRI